MKRDDRKNSGYKPQPYTTIIPNLIVRQMYEIIRPFHGQNIFHMISIDHFMVKIFSIRHFIFNHNESFDHFMIKTQSILS